jgi:phosphoglycerate kinase
MQKEVEALTSLLLHPKRPFYAIIGGAKISTKLGILNALSDKVDALFIGGGMAYPFLKVQGIAIGDSLCPNDAPLLAEQFLSRCKAKKLPIYLPSDFLIADAPHEQAQTRIVYTEQGIPEGWQGVDIGPETLKEWKKLFTQAATLFWNGPIGIYEIAAFAKGTNAVALALAHLSATTVVGGGDSVAALSHLHLEDRFTHISTGGGACLEWIEFGRLPGIEALSDKRVF